MSNLSDSKCAEIMADKAGPPPMFDDVARYVITAILVCIPVVTVVGNTITIVAVILHRRLRNITNAFVVSLAMADSLVAICVMPFGIYQQLNNKEWLLGDTFCTLVASMDVMFCTVSIFHLSCMAIDRYLAICRPFLHERMTWRVVAVMLFVCYFPPIFISFVPILNGWHERGIEEFLECFAPTGSHMCAFVVNIPFALICSAIAFYIPVVFMGVCNWKIYLAARRQAMQIRSLDSSLAKHHKGKGKFKQETKAAKTLSIIMGCFSVCWFPFFIFNIFDPIIGYKIPYTPWAVALWLGYMNSMMNPFLYYRFNRNFKFAIRRIFLCKACRGISEYEEGVMTGTTQVSE